jgi:uncharacterized protein (DUF305 family)
MNTASQRRLHAAVLLAAAATIGCSSAVKTTAAAPQPSTSAGGPSATPASNAANPADVKFVTGMIHHHAQAILMAGWAESHGARPDVRVLCERIVNAQQDEIRLMQYWLREHGLPVPDGKYMYHPGMKMDGMDMGGGADHNMLMPGMLTQEQLEALDKARGPEFDRLFLEGMIGHHQGALDMVSELLASPGAAQDDMIYKMSSDVYADQSTEIERMGKMLRSGPVPTRSP